MDFLEKEAASKGYCFIAGVDEAGRGPLAGPVVAAAVIFPFPPPVNPSIKDSKKLSASKRAALVFDIYRSALAVGVGIAWHDEIDLVNILRASLNAMERAVCALAIRPDICLVDGRFPFNSTAGAGLEPAPAQRPVISGDSLSISIAAASIIAKTARDSIMEAYHGIFPAYDFKKHKGYGTEEHLSAIKRLGPCPIHRRTFNGVVSHRSRHGA